MGLRGGHMSKTGSGSRVEDFGVKLEKSMEAPASRERHSVVYRGTSLSTNHAPPPGPP